MELLIRKPELAALVKRILNGLATEDDLSRANPEDIKSIKTSGEPQYRAVVADEVEKKADEPARSKRYVASDETTDRAGDIIRVKGWDMRNFLRNPQAFWSHNARELPIGLVTEWEKGTHKGQPALLETITYLEEGISPAADVIWKLVNSGVIKAVSVGFLPLKTVWPESVEEREEIGLGPYGVLFEKQEQLELSNCTIPMNPNALATRAVKSALKDMVKRGIVTSEAANQVVALGDRRKTVVQVPMFPAQIPACTAGYADITSTAGTTGSGDVWHYIVGPDGKMRQVKEPPAPPPAPPMESDGADEDLECKIDALTDQVKLLETQITEMRAELESVVLRALRQNRTDMRSTLQAAVARAGQRLATEFS